MFTGENLIGNEYSRLGQRTFSALNPISGEPLPPPFYEATPREVDRAVRKAQQAFGPYRRTTGAQRALFLEVLAEELLALGDLMIQTAMAETALPEARLQGERGRTVGQLRLFAALLREGSWVGARLDSAQPDRQPLPKPDLRQMLVPLGPVGVFGASNFPLAFSVAGGDTASALAAGCPVVFKAHPAHPATCELVGKAIIDAAHQCDLPDGVFSLLQGDTTQVGMALVQHPLVQAIGFTGSFRGGKAIYDAAVRREVPIPVYAEMGSTNPVFLLPGALRERAGELAKGLAASITLGVGQFCTNPGVFVHCQGAGADQFVAQLTEAMGQAPGGYLLTGGIRDAYIKGVEQLRAGGAQVLAQRHAGAGSRQVAPALLQADVATALAHPHLTEEVFGPASVGIVAPDRDQMLHFAASLGGHLTATVHGTPQDLAEYADLVDLLTTKVGRVVINGYPTGVEVSHAMVHGGPYPATTDSRSTSVGTAAIGRFARPVCYQGFPAELLPPALQDHNPLNIWRLVDGEWRK
jgi:NADP-dependent aldehyde dehydrogenase